MGCVGGWSGALADLDVCIGTMLFLNVRTTLHYDVSSEEAWIAVEPSPLGF